jgi:hypothetical protein
VTPVLFEVTIFKTKAGLAWSEVFKRGFSMRFISMIDMGLPQKNRPMAHRRYHEHLVLGDFRDFTGRWFLAPLPDSYFKLRKH